MQRAASTRVPPWLPGSSCSLLPIDGAVLHLQLETAASWRVHIARFERDCFVTRDSFLLRPSTSEAHLVAAKCVVDAQTGLLVPVLAFCSNSDRGGTAFSFGILDVHDRSFQTLLSFEASSHPRRSVLLCDGPACCVLTSNPVGGCELTAAMGGDAQLSEPAVRTVAFPFEVRSLCECSFCCLPSHMSLLLLAREPGHERVVVVDLGERTESPESDPSLRSLTIRPLAAPAVDALGAEVCCVAPVWTYYAEEEWVHPGLVEAVLRLWVATKSGVLHCCSLDSPVALWSTQLPLTPIRIEPLQLQYGSQVAVTLGATQGTLRVHVVSSRGEVLRELTDFEDWVAHDFLGAGHPQLLLIRSGFSCIGAQSSSVSITRKLFGYTLAGLHSTYADVPVQTASANCGSTVDLPAPLGCEARRTRLVSVVSALARRVDAGREAIVDLWRQSEERRVLGFYVEDLLKSESDLVSLATCRPNDDVDVNVQMEAKAGIAVQMLAKWRELASLQPVCEQSRSQSIHTGDADVNLPPFPCGKPRIDSLEHCFEHESWLLSARVTNAGTVSCLHLSMSVVHAFLELQVEGVSLAQLDPGATETLTLAAPLSSLFHSGALRLAVVLCWCELPKDDETQGLGDRSFRVNPSQWHRVVALHAQLDSSALFEASFRLNHSPVRKLASHPPSLSRKVSLLIVSSPNAGFLRQLPQLLEATLHLQPMATSRSEGQSDATARQQTRYLAAAAVFDANKHSPVEPLILRGVHTASNVILEASVANGAHSAEVRLAAFGRDAETVLQSATGTIQRHLPSGVRLRLCYASHEVLDRLCRAVQAMQEEVAGLAHECDEFLFLCDRLVMDANTALEISNRTGADGCVKLQRAAAVFQASTDEEMGLLHSVLV